MVTAFQIVEWTKIISNCGSYMRVNDVYICLKLLRICQQICCHTPVNTMTLCFSYVLIPVLVAITCNAVAGGRVHVAYATARMVSSVPFVSVMREIAIAWTWVLCALEGDLVDAMASAHAMWSLSLVSLTLEN